MTIPRCQKCGAESCKTNSDACGAHAIEDAAARAIERLVRERDEARRDHAEAVRIAMEELHARDREIARLQDELAQGLRGIPGYSPERIDWITSEVPPESALAAIVIATGRPPCEGRLGGEVIAWAIPTLDGWLAVVRTRKGAKLALGHFSDLKSARVACGKHALS